LRGNGQGIFYTLNYLAHLERCGVPVVNGRPAFLVETSKALQLNLLRSLGFGYPRARVISCPADALKASSGLRFPVVVKAILAEAVPASSATTLLQYSSERSQTAMSTLGSTRPLWSRSSFLLVEVHITRVETLGRKYLYAIRVFTSGESFNLSPADICQTTSGVELNRAACALDAPKTGLQVEG
jgi:hypothetical protein